MRKAKKNKKLCKWYKIINQLIVKHLLSYIFRLNTLIKSAAKSPAVDNTHEIQKHFLNPKRKMNSPVVLILEFPSPSGEEGQRKLANGLNARKITIYVLSIRVLQTDLSNKIQERYSWSQPLLTTSQNVSAQVNSVVWQPKRGISHCHRSDVPGEINTRVVAVKVDKKSQAQLNNITSKLTSDKSSCKLCTPILPLMLAEITWSRHTSSEGRGSLGPAE